MSRNGTGTYTLPAGNPVVTGTTISSTWANNTLTDIATALTGSLAADGQTTATGNLKMGANRITGLANGLASTDAATVGQIPDGTLYLAKASNLSDVANATTARGNLTAAKSGANSDITSLTGLTTPLTVAQGGTGSATLTANNVLLGNGTSAPQVVAPSTSGNVLTSNGTTWISSSLPTGSVLQVVNATYATQATNTTSTFSDSGLTASITPKFATSKILVLINQTGCGKADNNTRLTLSLVRNSTTLYNIEDSGGFTGNSTPNYFGGISTGYLDSPATTSATTYKTQFCSYSNVATAGVQLNGSTSTITLMEIAA
jgi:hypothetical protein